MKRIGASILSIIVVALAVGGSSAWGAMRILLEPPGPREFVLDRAKIIPAEAATRIKAICDRLLTDKATPIVVVTIDRMASYGGDGLRIETFATLLFDQWQVGQAKVNGRDWNTGILLVVSQLDRKARIELGAGWGRDKDALCQQIMNEQIIPRFKQEDYAGGIVAGVEGLEKMARGLQLPSTPRPASHNWLMAGAVALGIFTVVSLIRKGSGGWAWVLWAAIFAIVGTILYQMLTSRRSGGFSGGSFGGGFSGGGGASGSW